MRIFSKFCYYMVCSLALLLTACGTNIATIGKSDEVDEKQKILRVVTDAAFAPFEFLEGDGIKGFDIDFIRAVAEEAGYDVKIEHAGWEPLFTEIEKNQADFAGAAITITQERKRAYDFSIPYFVSTNMILVSRDSDIKSGRDLLGKKVAVQNGTTGQEKVENIIGENNENIRMYKNINQAFQALLSGKADAVVADHTVLELFVKNNPKQNVKVIADKSMEEEHYGLLFPKESELKPEIDRAIEKIFDNGTYNDIYIKWFGTEPDIKYLKKLRENNS